jgi:hypothetical protein
MQLQRATKIAPAHARVFKVLWYEVRNARAIINPGRAPVELPKATAKRRKILEVKARTLDAARRLAREAVRRQGVEVLAVNFTTRPNELVVYSKEPL